MRVLFAAPHCVGLAGIYGGVYSEMRYRASSLEKLGHSVVYLNPWEKIDYSEYDVCHVFMANADVINLVHDMAGKLPIVVSPIIDRYGANWPLRLVAFLGRVVPGIYTNLGKCQEICRIADAIVARSEDEVNRVEEGLGIIGKTIRVLSPLPLPPQTPAEVSVGKSERAVLFLGDMGNPRKNVFRLVSAFSGVKGGHLYLAGKLPEGGAGVNLQKMCAENPNIHILGPQTEAEKIQILQDCSAFVLPSLIEGIGLAAVEAGAMGKTVAVTENGGAKDYFGENAYYLNPFSKSSIRDAISRVLLSPINPSEHLRSILSPDKLGHELRDVYAVANKRFHHAP